MQRLVLALVAIVLASQQARAQEPAHPCATFERDTIEGVTERGDLVLAQGGPTAMAGLRLPDEPPLRDRALASLRRRVGGAVAIEKTYGTDRWNRVLAVLLVGEGGTCAPLASDLVRSGLAVWDPGPHGIVLPGLRGHEEAARKRSLGLWAEDRYKAIPVRQVDRLRERVGRFVLVEGRVLSVGERRLRTYLNFGSDWTRDFTLIVPSRVWREMTARGVTAAALKGRRIRARGVLEEWQGPALAVTVPEAIEVLGNERQRH